MPHEPAPRRAYLAGVAAAVAFRWFVATILVFLAIGLLPIWAERQAKIIQAPLTIAVIATPVVVPFLTGFKGDFETRQR